ncbi:S1C family serine protease [Roseomonas xinghualingensis]|uniref:S1C family serine protease n=1 Tax=Roseomonas xinghualingensis TaxID=2986475 RepID=UPI0021F108A6|nr:serine protease [Roseomonas sp. SXEYE001]MCV4209290.1 serine protease [Roseomonas sp. SXEYE001]
MLAPLAVLLPAMLLAASAATAQLVPAPGKSRIADPAQGAQPGVKPPPADAPLGSAPSPGAPPAAGPAGKPPPLYDMPDPAPRRPGPPSRPDPRTDPRPAQPPGNAPAGKPPPLGPNEANPPNLREISSGTGFVVAERQLLTNDHVVRDCRALRARNADGREIPATLRAQDRRRDLALLDLREPAGPPLTFRSGPDIRRGDSVVTYGFPLAGMLASGPTLTTGGISALAGLADNRAHFQISAPVQPGNSGGPLLDLSGHVVGVITSKLNAQRVAQRTGDIPQNVNFAVKAEEALAFLREHGVRPRIATSTAPRGAAEVGEAVHPSVLFLRCLR